MPTIEEKCQEFKTAIENAIDKREVVLYPADLLDTLPLHVQTEEQIRVEQELLKKIIIVFESIFYTRGNNE